MSDRARDPIGVEQELQSLGSRDDLFPATPDVVADLHALIEPAHPESPRGPRRFDRRLVAIIALVVLTAAVTTLAVPSSRTAIADFFGIEGIRIEFGGEESADDLPGTPTSIGASLLLGERTTLDQVAGSVTFDVAVPADTMVGEPDETYLNRRSGATVVGLLWRATDDLPEIGATGVGMLLLEIDASGDDVMFMKKSVPGGGTWTTTVVDNATGFWIENGVLTVEPVQGLMLDEPGVASRRSGNVLIWSDGEITYRLETSLSMADAVRIAKSLAPAGSP